ncbi:type II toxin-antitoxin system RelE/ParE family toxin [Methylomonas sp. SURF-2]|uniref:Type II toxin-antitoxin system RelE/ParE family toxin n=1 Tax=Methylomonas subterranea TaxID=2952225 RepID=A0ABT1TJZ3_9GAMM|nr:type II toxin-antitoxin system RelE/ParE family toxin [Methylomonas sp. SURF-2]MCQ8105791.1 type II toxin-antitoxin system RelE/ParE family toxin [Methylomonas sp. SURF-2]
MSQLRRVQWTKTARNDLRQVVAYLKTRSPASAASLLAEIKSKVFQLDRLAERGRVAPELLAQCVFQFRELLVSHWRIIYKIDGNDVRVLAVLDSRRNLEDLLLERMLGGES